MKFDKKNLKNKQSNDSNITTLTGTRKAQRKADRKQKKNNKALLYAKTKAKNKNTSIKLSDLENLTTTKKGNILSSLGDQLQLSNNDKSKKKKNNNNNSNKNNSSNSSIGLHSTKDTTVNNNGVKQIKHQNYANNEIGKLDTTESDINKNKSKNKTKNDNCKLISDKKKLENLRAELENDTMEINKLSRNLKLTSHQKKKGSFIDADFLDILNDIESGIFSDGNKFGLDDNENIDNFQNDMQFATGRDFRNKGKQINNKDSANESDDQSPNSGSDEDQHSEMDYDDEIESDGDNENQFIETDEDQLSETNEEGSGSDTNSKDDSSNFNGFIDAEAEEDDCDDNDSDSGMVDDDDEIIFESGSMLPTRADSANLSAAPPINSFFDLYSSNSEDDDNDADLEDFIVDDDVVEFLTDDEDSRAPTTVEKKKQKSHSRIVGRKLKKLNDSDAKSDHTVKEQVVSKRRRITSEESESDLPEIDRPTLKIVPDNPCKIAVNSELMNDNDNFSADNEEKQNNKVVKNGKKRRKSSIGTVGEINELPAINSFTDVKNTTNDSSLFVSNENCHVKIGQSSTSKNEPTKSKKIKLKSKKKKNINDEINTAISDAEVALSANGEPKPSVAKPKEKQNYSNAVSTVNDVPKAGKGESPNNSTSKIVLTKSQRKNLKRKLKKMQNCGNVNEVNGDVSEIGDTVHKSKPSELKCDMNSIPKAMVNDKEHLNSQIFDKSCENYNLNFTEKCHENDVKIRDNCNDIAKDVTNKPNGKNKKSKRMKKECEKKNIVGDAVPVPVGVNGIKMPKSILKQDSLTEKTDHLDAPSNSNSKGNKLKKQVSFSLLDSETDSDEHTDNSSDDEDTKIKSKDEEVFHEDIYGRLRDNAGRIINTELNADKNDSTKYTPPALRKLMELNKDEKKQRQMAALQRQLKGLLNRLTESNIAGIVSQVERLYQTNSRNDMNDSLVKILFEMLVTPVLAPERLVQEQALFIASLSANVGSEVGAQILTDFVVKWVEDLECFEPSAIATRVDSKELDNMLLFICHLYNFKVMNSTALYDMMNKLQERHLGSKEVDLILLILKSVGFTLRKDDPVALKNFITEIQSKASAEHDETNQQDDQSYTRVKFMLEVLVAIRNNNMSKVPNYDPTHIQHLKTLMKGLIRKGCRTSELSVSLQDLINSKTQGKWWIVGSAWSKELKENSTDNDCAHSSQEKLPSSVPKLKYSDEFYKKAAKLRMSRPPRINILYAITEGAENYIDAFQKLIELKLPPKQEQEIFSVMTYCCIRCKEYTEFYAHLALKLCEFKKEYQRLLQFSIWDKFRQLDEMKPTQMANLAKFIVHLVAENGLNLSVFKILNFAEANEKTISLLRQSLIGILLYPAGTFVVNRAFSYLCKSPKWSLLKQYIRVFILKFVNPSKCNEDMKLLASRVKMVLEMLTDAGVTL